MEPPELRLGSVRSPPTMHGECHQKLYKDAKRYSSGGPTKRLRAGGEGGELMFSSLTGRDVHLTAWRNGALEKTSVPTTQNLPCVRARSDAHSPVPPTNPRFRAQQKQCKVFNSTFKRFWLFKKKIAFFRKKVLRIRKLQTIFPTGGNSSLSVRTHDNEGKESAELARRNMKRHSGASPRRRTHEEIMTFQMFLRPVVIH